MSEQSIQNIQKIRQMLKDDVQQNAHIEMEFTSSPHHNYNQKQNTQVHYMSWRAAPNPNPDQPAKEPKPWSSSSAPLADDDNEVPPPLPPPDLQDDYTDDDSSTCDCYTPDYCKRPHTSRVRRKDDGEYSEDGTSTCYCSEEETCQNPHTHRRRVREDIP
mgnify:CR=1 FL=1